MAYNLHYILDYVNETQQSFEVRIYRKNVASTDNNSYPVIDLNIEVNGETQDKYDCPLTRSLSLTIQCPNVDSSDVPITWETFITSAYDEWKIIVTSEGNSYFHGFITPEEGKGPFQDKPYTVTIKATDGLALLKNIPLTKYDGTAYKTYGLSTLINLIAACLEKTKLELPIRIYCNYFHLAMQNRGDSLNNDMFQFTKVSHRTFLKSVNGFESCYDVLKIILGNGFRVGYEDGRWQIVAISELQYLPGNWYYTDYDKQGLNPAGVQVVENYAQIGKANRIFAINENQFMASISANKSVTHQYDYVIPEDLVINQKLQQLGAFNAPLSGSGYSAYEMVEWTAKEGNLTAMTAYSGLSNHYIRTEIDAFAIETDRYYRIEVDDTSTGTLGNYIQNNNTDFWVDQDDLLTVDFEFRINSYTVGTVSLARIAILENGADPSIAASWWTVNNSKVWVNGITNVAIGGFSFAGDTFFGGWKIRSLTDIIIPVSGSLYFQLGTGGLDGSPANWIDWRPVKINYTPYLKGSKFSVKGDKEIRSNNSVIAKIELIIQRISDSLKRIIKGALFINLTGADVLTDPTWYIYPATGTIMHFKEIINKGHFNNTYRRYYQIEGDFKSLTYSPENYNLIIKPIGFHKRYQLEDISPKRQYILIPPLKMNLVKGWITAVLVEVIKDSNDGTQNGDEHKFDYIF